MTTIDVVDRARAVRRESHGLVDALVLEQANVDKQISALAARSAAIKVEIRTMRQFARATSRRSTTPRPGSVRAVVRDVVREAPAGLVADAIVAAVTKRSQGAIRPPATMNALRYLTRRKFVLSERVGGRHVRYRVAERKVTE